jgi:hypothetical protein
VRKKKKGMAVLYNLDNFRSRGLLPSETEIQQRVRSVDIGTRNFAMCEVWRLKNGQYCLDRGIVADLKRDSNSQKIKEMTIAIDHLFNLPEVAWFQNPSGVVTICEAQMDHFKKDKDEEEEEEEDKDGKKKKKKRGFRPPIMYALQAAVITHVLRNCPQAKWPGDDGYDEEEIKTPLIEEEDDSGKPIGIVERQSALYTAYQNRSGKQKYGLEKFHEAKRKTETLTVAPATLEEMGDIHGSAWLEFVPKGSDGKPREDICDAVLQGVRWLEDQEKARQKAKRKLEREEKQAQKPAPKKRLRPVNGLIILDADASSEEEAEEPPPKKKKTM